MASVQKIKLSPSRDIPFNKLVLSQSNVRRVKAGVSIEQLAESIAQRTLLQSLSVRAVIDADGQETGMFEVPAGGRRYRALELLVKQKRMAKTQPVPCVIRDGGIAEDDSLAENDERVGLHPLDQFRAFQSLRDGGMSEEEIAARHFVTPAIVKQRLRLASISPKLHDVYAEDGMTLEQLMAFSVTADQARQEQVWDNVSRSRLDEPYQIRRMLTENTVRASDRRAQFIGLDAYEQAGGAVMRDLFEHDDGGWLRDVPLLDRLVTGKLKADAEAIAAGGWKWIAVAVDFPYGHTNGLRVLEGEPADLTDEERATLGALNAEYAKIEEDYQDADELPDEIDQRLAEIEAARSVFEARSPVYDPAEVARAGVFVSIDAEGLLSIDRGYVRPEDEAPAVVDPESEVQGDRETDDGSRANAPVRRAVITVGGSPVEPVDEDEDDTVSLLPLIVLSAATGTPLFKTSRPLGHLFRCLFGTAGMVLIFKSLAYMTLLDVTVLISTCPIFMVVLSVPMLREKVSAASWVTVTFGFGCVVYALEPTASTFSIASLLPLAGSVCVAIYIVSARMLASSESATALAAYMAVVGSVTSGGVLFIDWKMPVPGELGTLLAIGIIGGVGLLLRTSGYRLAPPAIVAPIEYSSILWSGLIGYLSFAEVPKIRTVVAGMLIVASNLTLFYFERRGLKVSNTLDPS